MARNATPTTPMSALSAFKKRLTRMIPPRSSHYETYTSKCHVPTVGGNLTFISRRQMVNGTPNHTHTKFLTCRRASRRKNIKEEHASLISLLTEPAVSQIGAIFLNQEVISKSDTNKSNYSRVDISTTLAERNKNRPGALITGTVDSGAMSNLWSLKNFTDNGFSRSDLVHVNMDTRAAKKNPFNIQGVD